MKTMVLRIWLWCRAFTIFMTGVPVWLASFMRLFLGLLLLNALLPFTVQSATQLQQEAALAGHIRDQSGAAVANAIVELYSETGEKILQTNSAEDGSFTFSGVQPGNYAVRVTIPNFATTVISAHVGFGESGNLDVLMNPREASAKSVSISEPPVYNALFSPTLKDKPTHLLSGKRTELRFYIGAENSENALSIPQWTVNPAILRTKGNIPLSITMTCIVCAKDRVQSKVITFSGSNQKSSEAIFKFIPQRNLAGKDGTGQILIDVMSRGVPYNHLAVNLQIEESAEGTEQSSTKETQAHSLGDWVVPQQPEEVPDIVLTVGREQSGVLTLQIDPILPELTKLLGGKFLKNGEVRSFQIKGLTDQVMQAALQRTSLTLRGFVDKENAGLQEVLARSPGGVTTINLDSYIQLQSEDRDKILSTFFSLGSFVYYKLFRESGAELEGLSNQLESFSMPDRPLRILVRTDGISFPWQLLHNDEGTNQSGDGFWGFKYQITVDSLARSYGGALPTSMQLETGDISLFGEYRASVDESPVVESLSQRQADYFRSSLRSENVVTVDSSKSFLDSMKQHNKSMDFLLVYAHGSSGSVIEKLPSGNVVIVDEVQGPRMMLSRTEDILPYDLEELPVGTGASSTLFLSRQPIVVLNACDTGTSAISRETGRLTLPVAFLDIGARGVVATEAPVWNVFAYQFGNDLITEMAKGVQVSKSLLEVRRKYLTSFSNPFGLLYSYYGSSNVKVAPLAKPQ